MIVAPTRAARAGVSTCFSATALPARSQLVRARLAAARLERRDTQANVLLAGVVRTAVPPALTILAVNIAATPTTQFHDSSGAAIPAAAFFGGLAGRAAVALGSWDGTTLTASSAALGDGAGEGGDD